MSFFISKFLTSLPCVLMKTKFNNSLTYEKHGKLTFVATTNMKQYKFENDRVENVQLKF